MLNQLMAQVLSPFLLKQQELLKNGGLSFAGPFHVLRGELIKVFGREDLFNRGSDGSVQSMLRLMLQNLSQHGGGWGVVLIEGDNPYANFVGTGPFVLTDFLRSVRFSNIKHRIDPAVC